VVGLVRSAQREDTRGRWVEGEKGCLGVVGGD